MGAKRNSVQTLIFCFANAMTKNVKVLILLSES